MPIELRWLRSFVTVADEMHFSRAARKLNLAQPALTTQIQQLENAVGSPLFERTNRMGGLTAAGRALLPEARGILERAGSFSTLVKRAALGETGHLRLGIIPPAATPALAEILRRFVRRVPGIELSVRQGDQEKLIDRLLSGDLDLLIARPTALSQASDPLSQLKLFTEEQGVLLRADDELAKLPSIPVPKLSGRRLLLLRGNVHFGQVLLGHAAKHGAPLLPVYSAEDFPSLHWMVRAGLGIAPCSLSLASGLPRGLVAKKLKPIPEKLEIHAIWRGTKPESTVSRLIELLRNDPS